MSDKIVVKFSQIAVGIETDDSDQSRALLFALDTHGRVWMYDNVTGWEGYGSPTEDMWKVG